ncbi:MAG TPA: hypothetical protein VJZ06_07685 [Mobilitalea sp.]|nr:hypothetical protein [Mobilitalea sp.]
MINRKNRKVRSGYVIMLIILSAVAFIVILKIRELPSEVIQEGIIDNTMEIQQEIRETQQAIQNTQKIQKETQQAEETQQTQQTQETDETDETDETQQVEQHEEHNETFTSQQEKLPEEVINLVNFNESIIDYSITDNCIYALINREELTEDSDLFVVFDKDAQGYWNRIYENDFTGLMPWKLETADIDGDLNLEILIAVQKTTTYDQKIKNRMFIFNYEEDRLVKKWTGSQIAGTWRDFATKDLFSSPGNELIFIETADDGGSEQISIYYWFDFGFFQLAKSKEYPNIHTITTLGENRLQVTYKEKDKEKIITLKAKEGQLIESQ